MAMIRGAALIGARAKYLLLPLTTVNPHNITLDFVVLL